MKRYIRNDQYIPDMTERFPEGMRSYEEHGDYGYEPDYGEWLEDYIYTLKENIKKYQDMSPEEFDALPEDERQYYYDTLEELREYDDSDRANWAEPRFSVKFDPEIMKTTGTIVNGKDVAGTCGEFTYGGYWAQIGDDNNYSEAHFDTYDEMVEYLAEKGFSIEAEDYLPFD